MGFSGPRANDPYVPPNRKWAGNPSSDALETPPQNETDDIPVARISLDPSSRILFSEKSSGTPVTGVEAPINGANSFAHFPTGAEFLEQVK